MQDLSKGGATTFFWWLLSCEVVASGRFVWLLFKFFNYIYIFIYLFYLLLSCFGSYRQGCMAADDGPRDLSSSALWW